jgi:hypothetical protein
MIFSKPTMQKLFTPDDLVRFIYKETSPEENLAIKKAILEDMELAKTYHGMLTAREELDCLSLEPSPSSLNLILEYSKNTVRTESH